MSDKKALQKAIAARRGKQAPEGNLSLFMEHIAREVLAEHMAKMEADILDYKKSLFERLSYDARELLLEAIKENWQQLKGPPGKPGTNGNDADVDLALVAKMAAVHVKVPKATVDIEQIKTVVKTMVPEQELDEKGEPVVLEEMLPEKVVEKINASKTPIKIEAIAGLSQYLKSLDRNIRDALRKGGGGGASGGGMGNPQHEQFPVTSATTAITLKFRIAANGFAIWAFYNDGMLVRTNDYTVGANKKTLTLTFTPQDPIPGQVNSINVVYIRT